MTTKKRELKTLDAEEIGVGDRRREPPAAAVDRQAGAAARPRTAALKSQRRQKHSGHTVDRRRGRARRLCSAGARSPYVFVRRCLLATAAQPRANPRAQTANTEDRDARDMQLTSASDDRRSEQQEREEEQHAVMHFYVER